MLQKTKGIHEQMVEFLGGTPTNSEDNVWIDEITFNVDISNSEIKEYLECMKNNPLSMNMSTTPWLHHCKGKYDMTDGKTIRFSKRFRQSNFGSKG